MIRQMMEIALENFHQFCDSIRPNLNHEWFRAFTAVRRYY